MKRVHEAKLGAELFGFRSDVRWHLRCEKRDDTAQFHTVRLSAALVHVLQVDAEGLNLLACHRRLQLHVLQLQ